LRVVVDRRARTPAGARVRDASAPTLLSAAATPADLLAELHDRGVRHVLLEGGPTLAAAFVDGDLVDEVVGYLAPALLGAGPTALAGTAVRSISAAHRLEFVDVARVGADVRLTARPVPATGRP